MCLGIPGRILDTYEECGMLMGKVDFGGISKPVCLAYTPRATVGKYVIVHVGFALQTVDEDEAERIFALLEQMDDLQDLQVDAADPAPPFSPPTGG